MKGVSDIIGVKRVNVADLVRDGIEHVGICTAIEIKTEKGKPSEHQEKFIERIKREGGIAFIAKSIEDVINGLGIRDRFLF